MVVSVVHAKAVELCVRAGRAQLGRLEAALATLRSVPSCEQWRQCAESMARNRHLTRFAGFRVAGLRVSIVQSMPCVVPSIPPASARTEARGIAACTGRDGEFP